MKSRFALRASLLVIVAATTAGCGTDPLAPVNTVPSPFIAQVSGQWNGSTQLVSVNAVLNNAPGECVQPTLQLGINSIDPVNLSVTQTAQTLSARLTSAGTGLACTYSGSATLNAVTLDLAEPGTCQTPPLLVRCVDGRVFEMTLLGSAVVGTVSAGSMTGTLANTYNAYQSGGSSAGATRLTLNYNYTATRQ